MGQFTVTKRISSTIYQIQDEKIQSVVKTAHRNHLVYYYPEEKSLPAMIEDYVPHNQRHNIFYAREGYKL